MTETLAFDEMTDRLFRAGEAVLRAGTPEMRAATRLLLLLVADEVERREAAETAERHRNPAFRLAGTGTRH